MALGIIVPCARVTNTNALAAGNLAERRRQL